MLILFLLQAITGKHCLCGLALISVVKYHVFVEKRPLKQYINTSRVIQVPKQRCLVLFLIPWSTKPGLQLLQVPLVQPAHGEV